MKLAYEQQWILFRLLHRLNVISLGDLIEASEAAYLKAYAIEDQSVS